jgi:isoquinoline 1-oxidoreductase beta subunit
MGRERVGLDQPGQRPPSPRAGRPFDRAGLPVTASRFSRRQLLVASLAAGAGLTLAIELRARRRQARGDSSDPNPGMWIRIAPDETVTITLDRTEMGQGVTSALAAILAEELEVPWEAVRVTSVVDDPATWLREVGTAASRSVSGSFGLLRRAGAAAREMLIAAAANVWAVDPASCVGISGVVHHKSSGRSLTYGSVADRAARLEVPATPRLKHPDSFRLVGKPLPRLDTRSHVDGSARFGIDVTLPGMLIASIERSPVFGGGVKRLDSAAALALPGVRAVVTLAPIGQTKSRPGVWRTYTEAGVAVLADGYWSALAGRRALTIEWDEGENQNFNTASLRQRLVRAAERPGVVAGATGNVEVALKSAAERLDVVYEVPLLHHATLEPMNCCADVRSDRCEVWAPVQKQTEAQRVAAAVSGVPITQVRVHTTSLGGGFGRRQENDFVAEAVRLSREVGRPVKVIWSREDDTRHGFYRPAVLSRLTAAVDSSGRPVAWAHRIVGMSIADWKFNRLDRGVDRWLVEGAVDLPYAIPNTRVEQTIVDVPIPRGFFRSTGASHNCYVTECLIDELAKLVGRDPYAFRRSLLAAKPRLLAVLDLAAERAGWGGRLPAGVGRGMAVLGYSGSFVAVVAEVVLDSRQRPVPTRFVCAIDCGVPVNPDIIAAQLESSVAFGLSAALYGEIEIDRGRVRQSNFHDYRILRLSEMPRVESHIVPSRNPAGGVGELGVAAAIPAFCNAVFAATGTPVRRLPLTVQSAESLDRPRRMGRQSRAMIPGRSIPGARSGESRDA